MTPYQRGQRDGPLAVAADLDGLAAVARAPMACARTAELWTERMAALNVAASLCRRRAESLPDDPEEKP